MSSPAAVLFVVWLVLSPLAVVVSALNLRRARELLWTTLAEGAVVRRHIRRATLGLFSSVAFLLVGLAAIAGLLGVVPSTGGVLISFGLDLALLLIIVDAVEDLRQ